ncbi:hypothetical protein OIO90_001733 [Microbotryomycetes sp. JL221]|nr:hypothetical protein OIO90_001733 [Microbotryomycetes sp. JL221]
MPTPSSEGTIAESARAACTLADAIKPSRDAIRDPKKPSKQSTQPKPNHIAPAPKNASERREWERMSARMQGFHEYCEHRRKAKGFDAVIRLTNYTLLILQVRQQYQVAWQSADKVGQDEDYDVEYYLWQVRDLLRHLEMHHNIEESYIFPILAKKMPEFGDAHPEEHKAIHEGKALSLFGCKSPEQFSADEMRRILTSWGPVLFYHLDAEVESLKPDNLRKYWTLEEVRRLPM